MSEALPVKVTRSAGASELLHVRADLSEWKNEFRSEYAAARSSRFRRTRQGVSGVGRSADFHLRNETDYYYMIEYVRDMHRNDGLIRQLTDRSVSLHIQNGFTPNFITRSPRLNRALKDAFYERWMKAHLFDVGGSFNGPALEKLAFKHMLIDGDHIVLGTETGHVQSIEGHRVRSPSTYRGTEMRLGVYRSALGDLYRYCISLAEDDPWNVRLFKKDTKEFDAWLDRERGIRQLFHVRSLDRASATRSATAYCPVFDYAGMFEDTNFALLVKQQLAAFLAISKETQKDAQPNRTQIGSPADDVALQKSITDPINQSVRTGSVVEPGAGNTYKVLTANIPSTETMQHLRFILQMLSLNLGMPIIAATLDASETNFSGWRGAMNIAEIGFASNQESLDLHFHTPYTRWWLYRESQAATKLGVMIRSFLAASESPEDLYQFTWQKPRLKSIQPVDDAVADNKRLTNGTHSMQQVVAEKGGDAYDVLADRIEYRSDELLRAHKAAEKLKKKGLTDVSWRDVLSIGAPAKPPGPSNASANRVAAAKASP